MRKLTALLMTSVFAMSVTAQARADDTFLRLGVGAGAAILGEVIKNSGNRKQPSQQRSTPSASGSRQSASEPRAVASKPRPVPDENVRFVQQKLHDLGYTEVGGADGFWGGNTAKALGIFMKDNGIEGEPKASPEIIAALAKARTRQQIADARGSAVAEATMPAAQVEDGIVHFGPKPEQQQVVDEHVATEDAVRPEDFSDEALTPAPETKTAAETKTPPAEQETASVPEKEPVPETTATAAAEPEATPSEDAMPEKEEPTGDKTVAAETPAPAPEETVAETKDDGGAQEINGLKLSGDF
jgi:hypothetical protein